MSRITALSLICLACGLSAESIYGEPTEPEQGATAAIRRKAFKLEPLSTLTDEQLRHPIVPALAFAEETLERMSQEVRDYTCMLAKRERLRGRLEDYQYISAKVRHQQVRGGEIVVPFSIYLRFLGPSSVKGREVLYVDGQYKNEMIARNGGSGNLKNLTMWMDPRGERALQNSHWPVTEFGIINLTQRLMEHGRMALDLDLERRECEVREIEGAKISGRLAKCIQIRFPVRRENLDFHIGRVFVDAQSKLPIRFAHYTWPVTEGGEPRLMAEYNYLDLKLNVGLSENDFDYKNPQYEFYLPEDLDAPRAAVGE